MAYKKKSKKVKRQLSTAVVHVKSTFNNTLVTITTEDGNVILSGSAGKSGFKGSRKGTPFAASQISSVLAKDMTLMGIKSVEELPDYSDVNAGIEISAKNLEEELKNDTI